MPVRTSIRERDSNEMDESERQCVCEREARSDRKMKVERVGDTQRMWVREKEECARGEECK